MSRYTIKHEKIADRLILLSSFWLLFIKCFPLPDVLVNGSIAVVGIICFFYYLFHGKVVQRQRILLFNIFLSVCMSFSVFYNRNAGFDNILWIWAYSGVAMLIVEYGVSKSTGFLVFWTSAAVLFLFASSGRRPEEFYQFGSANNVTAILLYAYFIYFVSSIYSQKSSNLSMLPPIVFLLVSIWSSNRSGLIVAAFMFLGIVMLNFTMGEGKNRIRLIVSVAILFVAAIFYWDSIYYAIGEDFSVKMERYEMESVRVDIWSEYVSTAFSNMYDFLFGVSHNDPLRTPLLNYWDGNTHNCFLMLHSKYGILGFVAFIYLIIKKLIISIKEKQFYASFIIMVVIIRGFFDWVAFPGLLDVAFFWFIFKQFKKDDYKQQSC